VRHGGARSAAGPRGAPPAPGALPERVKNAVGLQLLFEPDAAHTGGALAVKGELQQRCRVGLPITVDQDGTQAKFRRKMRTLLVTMPVKRDPSVTITS